MHSSSRRLHPWPFVFAFWLASAGAIACRGTETASPESAGAQAPASAPLPAEAARYRAPEGTPVLLVSIDTLRSDRLPVYGFDGVATPAIDRLRSDAILYRHAYSHMGLTLPSHLSILSGRLPLGHGVRDNLGYRFDSEKHPTLPLVLAEQSYTSAGFVSSYVLRATTGIAGGFAHWDDEIPWLHEHSMGSLQRDGALTLERTLDWLDTPAARQPLFLFFHLYEPHSPYQAAEPWASRYADPYVAEVAEADFLVGRLLDELRERQLYDRSLIFLLSDHGEGLMDHGEKEHEILIYREVLQVPLLVKLPGGRFGGTTVETPAQLVDVAPTIYSVLGIAPPLSLDGRSLLEIDAEPDRHVFSESVYPRLHLGWSELGSIIQGRHHLIDGRRAELFDLRSDPAEREDLAGRQSDVLAGLKTLLADYDRTLAAPEAVDPETREALAALGYLSGGPAEIDGDSTLPDPRDRIAVLDQLGRATQLSQQGRHGEAATLLQGILESEPDMVHAWEQLAKELRAGGRVPEAIDAYREALEASGGAGNIHLSLAELYLDLGQLPQARTHSEAALPNFEVAWDLLAQIDLQEGDLASARRHLDQALARRGGHLGPLITEASWLVRAQRFEEAVAVTERAEAEFGDRQDREVLRGLYFQRASALLQLDRLDEAEEAYRAEIAISPEELAPYSFLAFLHALEERPEEVHATLTEMIETNPTPLAYQQAIRTLRALGDEASADRLLATARQRWPGHPALTDL